MKNKCTKAISLLASFSLLILLSGCAEMFQKRLDLKPLPPGELFRLAETGKLDAPQQLFASKGGSPTTITLSWEKVAGAVSYLIECAEDTTGGAFGNVEDLEWNTLENSHYNNRYEHTILQVAQEKSEEYGKRFYYRVTAKNEREGRDESQPSNVDYGVLLAPVSGVEADKGEDLNGITIKWTKAENPDYTPAYYDIYRSRNSDGSSAVKIGERLSDRATYTDVVGNDERGIEFYYVVYARNKNGVQSARSSAALGFARVPGAPGKPSGMQATRLADKNSGIPVKWDSTSGAEKYYLYRSSSVDSSLTLLAKLDGATAYTDKKSLKDGVYYYYQVQAVKTENGKELKSAFSDNTAASEGFVLSPPSEMDAEKAGGDVKLRWQPAIGNAEEQGRFEYKIYSDPSKDGAFANPAGSVAASSLQLDAEGYYEYTVQGGGSFFKIETVANGKTSAQSAVFAPAPLAATNISATRTENVGGSANNNGVYAVRVTWQKPAGDSPDGYHVYRSTSADSGYRKITESPVPAGSTLTYLDKDDSMKAGKYYYYKVLAVNVLGQGKNYSDSTHGYGALTHEQFLKEFGKQITSSQKKLTLMHKGGTSALGSESAAGNVSGTLSYSAVVAGLGARITMPYSNYCDAYIDGKPELGRYMIFNGNTNTTANMSSNGSMDGTVNISGMYEGSVGMGNIQVKAGKAGGGHYPVTVKGFGTQNIGYKVIN